MRAFVIEERDGVLRRSTRERLVQRVDDEDVLVRVEYSSINFKDVMVASAPSRVRRVAELVGGVDAAGVVEHDGGGYRAGESVAVHGGALGVARDGGFAEHLYAPARWLSRLAPSLSTREAMVIGTAGFTSMASVLLLEDRGLTSEGRVVVTGATGGVGSQAVTYLARRGYSPIASTGSSDATAWLLSLGASEVIGRDELSDKPDRLLGSELWDGAIDCVGGSTLASILRSLRYGAAVAASGLVASAELATAVYPFITRANALLGVDAVECSTAFRSRVWDALAMVAPSVDFGALTDQVVGLDEIDEALDRVERGVTCGRVVIDVTR